MAPLMLKFSPTYPFHTLLPSLLLVWKGAISGYRCELLFLLLVQRRLNTTRAPPASQVHVIILSYTAVVDEDISPAPLSSIFVNSMKRGRHDPWTEVHVGQLSPASWWGGSKPLSSPLVRWEVVRAGSAGEGNLKPFDMSPFFSFHLNPPVHTYFIFSSDSMGGTEFCEWGGFSQDILVS